MPILTRLLPAAALAHRHRAATPAGEHGVEIAVRGLVCRFAGHTALDGLDLVARRGEVTAVVGPSGAGKSTLLRIVAGLVAPDAGTVRFDDVAVDGLPPEKRRLGVVFQSYALFPHLTVADNVAFALRVRGNGARAARAETRQLLERLEIAPLADRHPHQLSGGERQRVALARALAARPRALLLDEPLAALDARLRLALRDELAAHLRRSGLTALYVTHDQEEAMALGDRVAVLRAGRLEQVGTPEELYRRPANELVATFFGEATFVAATWEPRSRRVTSPLGDLELATAVDLPAGPVRLMVRPASLVVDDPATAGALLRGRVRSATFLGDRRRLLVEIDALAAPLAVDLPARHAVAPGDLVALRLDPTAVALLPVTSPGAPR